MSKEKLQVCVSFKHTKEEEDLYMFTLDQGDKSIFIKNLIRAYREGRVLGINQMVKLDSYKIQKEEEDIIINNTKIQIGKKTKSKFLA